ncbi:ead/Ea22-like family protein [Salmonella enterica]|nr:ead/Ea22-like family protein [Salmonella enterica]EJJ4102969.1 ead/Ea22-like family protein [Salmonella enterica]ELG7064669.1 ead/Ea22-like family protein [Salmonella enterica]ELG7111569.1 ead/Ea22-like family protein [Salmonella enterica]ELG7154871.1 ead/Ea22-like family protein [Salmonella enterica]
MSNINKQALREVAEKATPGNWRRASSRFNGITVTPFSLCDEEVMLAHAVEKRDAEFIVAANPATMLALLDENLQLQREKDAIEAVALALRDDMRDAREKLEAAERRIAELEAKLETADKLQDSAFRDGLKAGFSYGQTDDQSGFAQCMSAYSTRTDIGVKQQRTRSY